MDQATLAKIYQASDIFLLPSENEGFPLSIQEAMASGLPIISKYDAGYAQYSFDKNMAYFLKDTTEPTLRKVITEMIRNDEQLVKMSEYSSNYAQNHFSWSHVISKLTQAYDSLFAVEVGKKKIAILSDAVYPFNKG